MAGSGSRSAPWLGRFELPAVLRSQGAFHLASTREQASGEPRLVAVGAPGRDPGRVRAALGRLARVHRRLDHPRIARVADEGEHQGAPFVAFDCDAVVDLGLLLREARRVGLLMPHPKADGFILGLRKALQAAHAVDDEGRPVCLGTLCYGNVLFGRDGRHWLVGFGYNVVTLDEHGGLLGGEPVFQAPELSVGGLPSPGGDFVALITMMRSMIPAVGLAAGVARVLVGNSLPEDLELVRCLLWFERRVIAALPSRRASIDEAIEVSNRIRALLGVVPDPEGFEREAASALRRLLPEPPHSARGELRVGPEAAWMESPDGSRHQLSSRGPLRRVLLALAEARLRRAGEVLPMASLIEAGWPGERTVGETGANRTYVLLSTLRRMGLRGSLQRLGEGYRLDPSLPVRIDAPG